MTPTPHEFLCEVNYDGEEIKLLRGGRGGLGNWHFKSSTNRTPRYAQPGEPTIEKALCWSSSSLPTLAW